MKPPALTRREFGAACAGMIGAGTLGQGLLHAEEAPAPPPARAIYYNNFASHLLCAYNPNVYYPQLPYRWNDEDWTTHIDMLAWMGYNVYEFWLEPRFFTREAMDSPEAKEFARQMNLLAQRAHERGMKVEMIACFATVGNDWRTLCPNLPDEWSTLVALWEGWLDRLPGIDIVGIFPGDPGACSRNGCTAETYIDKSAELAARLKKKRPSIEIEFNTWGPPFFGWGNIHMPPDSKGEFIAADQATAWTFTKERADKSMQHLVQRLPDFPADTWVSINMGFNPDGNPIGDQDARPWAREIAKQRPILTWDFSLTEGENAVYPHHRLSRLFQRRKEEREGAPYQGGICFTMTPLLNQLSHYAAAQSFKNRDADPEAICGDYFEKIFGAEGRKASRLHHLFEVVPDWGAYAPLQMPRPEYHAQMTHFAELLNDLKGHINNALPFHPAAEQYHASLVYFAELFRDLSGPHPDYAALKDSYWRTVYGIWDHLPNHVDPRPHTNTDRLIKFFRDWGPAQA